MSAVYIDDATGRFLAWKDSIPLQYEYTAGVAGEAFLQGLKGGRLVAGKCIVCGEIRIPPRIYCMECGARTRIDVEVLHLGRIVALSTVHVDARRRSTMTTGRSGTTFGYVTFAGVSGGLVHKIIHTGKKLPTVGGAVMPFFVPVENRRGSILDIEGFRTTARH